MPLIPQQQPPYYTQSDKPKVYTAILNQVDTNPPTATILTNTLGEIPVWTYLGVGYYRLTTINPIFLENTVIINLQATRETTNIFAAYRVTEQTIELETVANDKLIEIGFQITVYP